MIVTEKERWLEFWNLSGEEGERAWQEKQQMDAGFHARAPQIMPDIQPYQSQVDGSMISSRSKHREHLRQHRLIEIGDQVHHMKPFGIYKPKGVKEDLIREVYLHKERNR